jgi:hypothetical protein
MRRAICGSFSSIAAFGIITPDEGARCLPSEMQAIPCFRGSWKPVGHTEGRATAAATEADRTITARTDRMTNRALTDLPLPGCCDGYRRSPASN